jgi:hypothetical protein
LEVKTELFSKDENPLEGFLDDMEWDVWVEDFKKIIEVMTDVSRNMTL